MKRIKYGKEPVLHVHRYIVSVHGGRRCKFHYCENLDEVQQVKNAAQKGSVIEIFSAHHNFREAFQK